MTISRSDLLADLVQAVAAFRQAMPVPREYIDEALERIQNGQEPEVKRYPNGMPTMIGVYEVATRLEAARKAKQ